METRTYILETIDDFAHLVKEEIGDFLPEEFSNASFEIQETRKNNETVLYGLRIRRENSKICPVIYLDEFYKNYTGKKYTTVDETMKAIAEVIEKQVIPEGLQESCDDIESWEKIKNRIVARIINKDWNDTRLMNVPYVIMADLAVTFHVVVYVNEGCIGTVEVTWNLMEKWGVDIFDVYEEAVRNLKDSNQVTFQPMSSVLNSLISGSEIDMLSLEELDQVAGDLLYVLTTRNARYGAVGLLDDRMMNAIYKMFSGKFYIIPSSIHELIIVNKKHAFASDEAPENIVQMISEVNRTQVPPEERLSGNLYSWEPTNGLYIVKTP